MGVLSRFNDIMTANANAVLDKLEDPSKMVDQLLRDLNDDLGKVKAETAGVMAEESRAKRTLDDCSDDIGKMQAYAEKAVVMGNDADAREFLQKKAALTEKRVSLEQSYDLAAANAAKMRQMHDKLTAQIGDLNSRKDAIKAKVQVAKTQERMNKMTDAAGMVGDNAAAMDRLEEKADAMLDRANAMAELNTPADSLAELEKKYAQNPSKVEDELAAIKAKLGQ